MTKNIQLLQRKYTIIPLLSAVGAVVFIFEAMIPQPVPWAKLGISNIAVVLTLYYYRFPEALGVSWLRVIIGGFFTGGILSPAFFFGITGGLFSAVSMAFALKLTGKKLSPVGISIIGAAFHSLGQLSAAAIFFINQKTIWNLLPYMVLTSVFTGAVVGFISINILKRTFHSE